MSDATEDSPVLETEATREAAWPSTQAAWYGLILVTLAYAFAYLDRVVISLLIEPIKAEFGLSDTQMGLLTGLAFAIFYGVLGVPAGWLADRANRRNVMAVGITLWSLATAACGFAGSYIQLFISRVCVGVGEAVVGPTSSSYIADLFRPSQRAKAFGVYLCGTSAGTGLAFLISAFVIEAFEGIDKVEVPLLGALSSWQAVFIIVGLMGLPMALIMMTAIEPKRRGRLSAISDARVNTFWDTLRFMAGRPWAYISVIGGQTLIAIAIYGSVSWQPAYFIRVHDWSPQYYAGLAGVILPFLSLFSAISAGFVTGFFVKRGIPYAPLLTAFLGTIWVTLTHVLMPFMPGPYSALIVVVSGTLTVNWMPASALAALNQVTPNEMRAQTTAIHMMIVGIMGISFGPLIVGVMNDVLFGDPNAVGYSLALLYGVGGAVTMLLLALGFKPFAQASEIAKAWEGK